MKSRALPRRLAGIAFVLSLGLTVPAFLVLLLFAGHSVNPMALAFLTTFQVRNDSKGEVQVWVGGRGESGRPALLPLHLWEFPAVPAFRSGGFGLKPGAVATITYDWDDTNFTVIIVKTSDGELLAMPVDGGDNRVGCCTPHRQELYVIPSLRELRQATADERELVSRSGLSRPWVFLTPSLAIPLLTLWLWRMKRQLRDRTVAGTHGTGVPRGIGRP